MSAGEGKPHGAHGGEQRSRLLVDHGEMTEQELGVTRQTVSAIELGQYSPSLEVAFSIAHVFLVPPRGGVLV